MDDNMVMDFFGEIAGNLVDGVTRKLDEAKEKSDSMGIDINEYLEKEDPTDVWGLIEQSSEVLGDDFPDCDIKDQLSEKLEKLIEKAEELNIKKK